MGLFDRGSGDEILAVNKLVNNAESETVTKKILTKTGSGLFGGNLHDRSILTYLNEGEQPHYILYNEGKGLIVNDRGEKEEIKPSDEYKAYAVLTDERILFLIGREDGNHAASVSQSKLEQVDVSTGVFKHRLDIKTNYTNYRFYVNIRINSDELKRAKLFLDTGSGIPVSSHTHTSTVKSIEKGQRDQEFQTQSPSNIIQEKDDVIRLLRNMDPYDFEHFIADLWHAQGWITDVSQASVDEGIDIIAIKESPFPQKQVIQAKRYNANNTVGGPEIQQYASLRQQVDGADITVVVTTSSFSKQARDLGSRLNVKLVDSDGIYDLLEDTGRFDLIDEYTPLEIQPELDDVNETSSETATATGKLESAPEMENPFASIFNKSQESIQYGSCPMCDYPNSYRYTFRKDLTLPWTVKCTKCETEFHIDEDENLQDIENYLHNKSENSSRRWYYGVLAGVGLSIIGLLSMNIILFLVAWILVPLSMSRDILYIRRESERRPASAYWVWSAILTPPIIAVYLFPLAMVPLIIVGTAYLIHRYRVDTVDSNLHTGHLINKTEE